MLQLGQLSWARRQNSPLVLSDEVAACGLVTAVAVPTLVLTGCLLQTVIKQRQATMASSSGKARTTAI